MSSSCASCRSLQTVRVQIRECDVGDVVKRGALKEEPRTDANVKMTARGGSIWWRGVDVKEGDKLCLLWAPPSVGADQTQSTIVHVAEEYGGG